MVKHLIKILTIVNKKGKLKNPITYYLLFTITHYYLLLPTEEKVFEEFLGFGPGPVVR